MNIGIDIDDTISKTFEIVCELAKKYNTEELKRNEEINLNKDITSPIWCKELFAKAHQSSRSRSSPSEIGQRLFLQRSLPGTGSAPESAIFNCASSKVSFGIADGKAPQRGLCERYCLFSESELRRRALLRCYDSFRASGHTRQFYRISVSRLHYICQ